jgi:hypothetical protein
LESPVDTLIETVFRLDERPEPALLRLGCADADLSFEVRSGRPVSSSLRGPGQTFADYLLETGAVTRAQFEDAMRLAKEGETTLLGALRSEGVLDAERIGQARRELAVRRFMDSVQAGVTSVDVRPLDPDDGEPGPDAPPLSTLLLEELWSRFRRGDEPVMTIPSYAVLRPAPRLGRYMPVLEGLMDPVPLPRVGGESYATLKERHGDEVDVPLSLLLGTGMLQTEFEAPEPASEDAEVSLEMLARLLVLEARRLMAAAGDDGAERESAILVELGDAYLGDHGALLEALRCYERARRQGSETPVAGRLVPLLVMASRGDDPLLARPLARIGESADETVTAGELLRAVAFLRASDGEVSDAMVAVREALRAEPESEDALGLFVQLFERRPRSIMDLTGVEPAGLVIGPCRRPAHWTWPTSPPTSWPEARRCWGATPTCSSRASSCIGRSAGAWTRSRSWWTSPATPAARAGRTHCGPWGPSSRSRARTCRCVS